ncbi:hypothetical protein FOZ60_014924 [Perkinsus olseni]|uniref:Uncharacterized protein n=1 Tax=Perkinsus olseni TaxID=32597 RepID=A0A7J6P6J2_PEROL|nr:hypothetical protein FOZ60_014924 [Perkinsus olseni]
MPAPRHAHYSVISLLLALIDLVGATPPSIEAGHYEGLVDSTRPIGTLKSIAMNVGSASALQNVTPSTMKFSGKAVNEESTMITIAGVNWGLEEMEVPSRAGDLFKSLPLADVGELPVGSLVNSDDTGPFYLVCLTLQTDEEGRQLGQLNLASSALSPTGAPTTYFQFANATEDTPPSNVLILPLMPLVRTGCDADCYIFAGLADPADQAEVEASLTAAGRAFGINNLTLESIRLHRSGMDGGHFELRLGAEPSDPGKPSIRVQPAYVPFISDGVKGVYDPLEAGGSQPQEVRSLSQPRKRRLDEPSLADGGKEEKKDCMDC